MIKHASGSWRPARNIKKSVYSYRPSTARSPSIELRNNKSIVERSRSCQELVAA